MYVASQRGSRFLVLRDPSVHLIEVYQVHVYGASCMCLFQRVCQVHQVCVYKVYQLRMYCCLCLLLLHAPPLTRVQHTHARARARAHTHTHTQRTNALAREHALERSQRYLGRTLEVLVEERNVKMPHQVKPGP
jgi:hypothetical protein